jgi:serine/threonine protein kinase
VVHGDIKWVSLTASVFPAPSAHVGGQNNIFVDDRASAKIADFGLAIISEVTGGGTTTTHTGPKGTVAWMSPERIDGTSRLTPPMDVYSFGILCLTVRPPSQILPSSYAS